MLCKNRWSQIGFLMKFLDDSAWLCMEKLKKHVSETKKLKQWQEIKEQSIKNNLKKLTNDAFKKEVFGVPTFIVNNKIFWGQDRLEYAVEEFADD